MKQHKGQASLLLIILSAIAIILFAITLNWGRISQYKNVTTVAATTSASQLASNYASYAEMLLQTQLGGQFQKCKHNSIFGALLTLILVIVIIAVTGNPNVSFLQSLIAPGGGLSMAGAALAMSAASLVLQVTVVQPGLTRYWNQLQKDAGLSSIETFVTGSLQNALQNVIDDHAQITDYFDSNTNGRYGFNTLTGQPEDTISRYAFYNTEYLRGLKSTRSNIDLSVFTTGLTNFIEKITKPKAIVNDPRYNPCCLPLLDADGQALRPSASTCPDQNPVPATCNGVAWSGSPDFYGNTYPLAYDPARPDYRDSDSFLANLGIDQEVRPFGTAKAGEATRLFKALWDMDNIRNKPSVAAMTPTAPDTRIPDIVDSDPNFFAPMNACLETDVFADGLNWKPGKDSYCSTLWPYSDCPKNNCAAVETGDSCCTTAAAAAGDWPEDLLDQTIDELKEFYIWSKLVLQVDASVLASNLDNWYDNSADLEQLSGKDWLGPACLGNNEAVCASGGYNNGQDGGVLYTILNRLRKWEESLGPWLARDFSDANAWCVPSSPAGLSTAERNAITNNNTYTWGTLPTVVNCLRWYSDDTTQYGAEFYFKRCQDRIEGIKDGAAMVARFEACKIDYDKAIQAETFDACLKAVNTKLAKANASTQYNACLDKINALKNNASYCNGNPTAPPTECTGFSLAAPSPQQPQIYDACSGNSTFMNWINQSIAYFGETRAQYCASPSKPEPVCTTGLISTAGQPSFDVCTGNAYTTWLQNQITAYGGNTIAQICSGTTFAACQNLPASSIIPMPDPCLNPAAHSVWLEDSKASYNTGLTFNDYCSLVPVPVPAECNATEFPRSTQGSAPTYDVCSFPINAKGGFQTWLDNSMNAMNVVGGQKEKFKNRHDYLKPIMDNVTSANGAINTFANDLEAFLDGPVQALINARNSMNTDKVDSVPNTIIYGWQDNDKPVGKNRDGYWHVVRVSATAPGKLASIGTKRKGFLGMTRCYFLRDYSGQVRIQVDRWDEDHDQARFANKIPIWKVTFKKPGTADVQNPKGPCIGDWTNRIGLSTNPDTYTQLSAVWGAETANLTKDQLKGAFMINGEPAEDSPNRGCFDFVTHTLLPAGISTTVCARYTSDNKTRGLGVRFEKCQ